jgi:pimeloyl-ACP methyl ester carboxylesterase
MDKKEKKIWCKGEGETIIFIHGLVGNHTVFKEQVNEFSKSYRTVTYNLLGHGGETEEVVDFSMDRLINQLLTIYEKLQIQKAHFCSLSFGTYIANEFAFRYPEKVSSLCHIGGSYNNPSILQETLKAIWEGRDKHYRDWLQYFAFKMNPYRKFIPDVHVYKPRIIFQKYGVLVSKNIVMQALNHMVFNDTKGKMKRLEQPVLWTMGEYDYIRKTCLYDLEDVIPQVKYLELPDAAHVAHLFKPKLFNRKYKKFVSEVKEAVLT